MLRRRAGDESTTAAAPGTAPAPAGPAVSGQAASLLAIQRTAGNAAANALLRREPAAAPAKPSGYESAMQELYAPEMQDIGVKGVDKAKADGDLGKLATKLADIPALKDTDFLHFMQEYVSASMRNDGGLALEMMYSALFCLDSVGAFTVGDVYYRKLTHKPDAAELAPFRAKAMSNVHLWSKLNKYHAIDTVKGGTDGVTLESSAAGALFDGLTFGMDYGTNKVLGQQWKMVSKTFVAQSVGVVHAQVLRGIDESSVLFKTEWPEIRGLIEQGRVLHLTVHYFDLVDGKLVETGTPAIIRTQAEFDALPRVSVEKDADYKRVQNETYHAEEARHAAAVAAAKARVEDVDQL